MQAIQKADRLFGLTRSDGSQWLSDGFRILPLAQSRASKDILIRERFAKSPNWRVLGKGRDCEALSKPIAAIEGFFERIPTLQVYPSVLWGIPKRTRTDLGIGQVFYSIKGVCVVSLEFLPENFRDLDCFQADTDSVLYFMAAEGQVVAICMPVTLREAADLRTACEATLNAIPEL